MGSEPGEATMIKRHDPACPASETRSLFAFKAIAWGRTVGAVLLGAALGAGYSLGMRPVSPAPSSVQLAALSGELDLSEHVLPTAELAAEVTTATPSVAAEPPVELAALPDEVAVRREPMAAAIASEPRVSGAPTSVHADLTVAAKPAAPAHLRDVSLQPVMGPTLNTPPMAFRSIATLSASSPRLEAEVRYLKGTPAAGSEVVADSSSEKTSRPAGKVDAVAAVWGFLAVGLAGSTVTAGPRPAAGSGSGPDRRLAGVVPAREASAEERENSRFLLDQGGRSRNRMIGLATLRD
jgi:hypothetical protein